MKNKLKMIVGFDLILSLVIVTALILCLPGDLSNSFSRDIYNVGISVLSIVFSIFIAALGIIMSSGSDDFIAFLEEEKQFSLLIWGFKFTLLLLLIALLCSLLLYSLTSYWLTLNQATQNKYYFICFSFLFIWSLLATLQSTLASARYSQFRIRFLDVIKKHARKNESSNK